MSEVHTLVSGNLERSWPQIEGKHQSLTVPDSEFRLGKL